MQLHQRLQPTKSAVYKIGHCCLFVVSAWQTLRLAAGNVVMPGYESHDAMHCKPMLPGLLPQVGAYIQQASGLFLAECLSICLLLQA